MTYLADSNVLIALAIKEHSHHGTATQWLLDHRKFATCPITEGSLIRYVKRVSPGENESPRYLLDLVSKMPGWCFWPADLSYEATDLEGLRGYNQVTDAYLVALAKAKCGRLATFDEALVAMHPEAFLIPS